MNYGYNPDPGEETLRIIHRTPITLVPAFGAGIALILLAGAFAYIGGRYPDAVPHAGQLMGLLATIFVVLAVIAISVALFVYRRNVLIFTNMHLIQVEQIGLFNHQVSQLAFARVQDVSGNRVGIWQTLFNFGDVIVQTAGEEEKFIFKGASNPSGVADDALQTRDLCMAHNAGLGGHPAAPPPPVEQSGAPTAAPEPDDGEE